jgi:hypothetical protein
MKDLQGFVWKIPELAKNDFEALPLEDIVVVTTAFEKVGVVFGNFLRDFTQLELDAVWRLLETRRGLNLQTWPTK